MNGKVISFFSFHIAGGAYGIARVTLGIFPGYLVACFDSYESILFVAAGIVSLGQMITTITHNSETLEPVYWLIIYVGTLAIHIYGGMLFWRVNSILGVVSTTLLLIYIIGCIQFADFGTNAALNPHESNDSSNDTASSVWFQGGMREFMRILPLPCFCFVGVELLNLACRDVPNPKQALPRAYITSIATLVVTCFSVLFVCCSVSPGVTVLVHDLNPLNNGFARLFSVSYETATYFALPGTYAVAFGFMFCYGRQLRSMARSGLLNRAIGQDLPGRKSPVYALLLGFVLGYAACLATYFYPTVGNQLINIALLGTIASYFSQFASFVVLREAYPTIKREFVSPLGIAGAVYGCTVFALVFVGICAFQADYIPSAVFAVFVATMSAYYYVVVRHRQSFSEEEKEVLFRAYLVKSKLCASICFCLLLKSTALLTIL